jgi:hypothetical protein
MIRTFFAGLLLVTTARAAEGPAAAPPTSPATTSVADHSRYAKIDITIPPNAAELNAERTIQHLTERAGELAPRMVGLSEANISDWLEFRPVFGQQGIANFSVIVNLRDGKARPSALTFAEALVDALRQYQKQQYDLLRTKHLDPAEQALKEARDLLERSRQHAAQAKAEIRELSGRSDASGIGQAVTKMEEELTRLELDELAKSARREALEKEIAHQAEKVEKKIASDAIAVELEKVVEAREEQRKRLQLLGESGTVPQAEVSQALAGAAEARAKLLERKRDAAAEAGGDALAALNRELITLSIDLHECHARLDYIRRRLPKLRDALDLTEVFESARRDASEATSKEHKAAAQLQEIRKDLADVPELIITSRESREKARDPAGNEISIDGSPASH